VGIDKVMDPYDFKPFTNNLGALVNREDIPITELFAGS
jgi:hypothetical protein